MNHSCKCPDCSGSIVYPCSNAEAGNECHGLLEWAVTLMCSATPNAKLVLTEEQQQEWCQAFGKWFAETQNFLTKNKTV